MLDKSTMYISIPFLIFEIFYKWIITILESLKVIERGNLLLKIADFFFFFVYPISQLQLAELH